MCIKFIKYNLVIVAIFEKDMPSIVAIKKINRRHEQIAWSKIL